MEAAARETRHHDEDETSNFETNRGTEWCKFFPDHISVEEALWTCKWRHEKLVQVMKMKSIIFKMNRALFS